MISLASVLPSVYFSDSNYRSFNNHQITLCPMSEILVGEKNLPSFHYLTYLDDDNTSTQNRGNFYYIINNNTGVLLFRSF